jgi:hypothetical protein
MLFATSQRLLFWRHNTRPRVIKRPNTGRRVLAPVSRRLDSSFLHCVNLLPNWPTNDCFEACASDIDGRPAKPQRAWMPYLSMTPPINPEARGERRNLPHVKMAAAGKHFGDDALAADLEHLPD